jgi:DNA-binding transcriptional LysR family regulator
VEARELRYFVAVADERHFGRAAQRLAVASPALSRTVRKVETELGVELLLRDSQSVRLTSAGEALLRPARDALAVFDEAVAASREAAGHDIEAVLAVGVSPLLRHRLGPSIFERFACLFPAIKVCSREEFGGLLVEELLERRIDCAIALFPARHHELAYEPIRDAQLMVLLSARHPLATRGTASLHELEHDLFQLPSDSSAGSLNKQIEELCASAGFELKRSATPVEQDMDLAEIRANRAVTLVSRFYVEEPSTGMALLGIDPPLRHSFELVRRRERAAPALSRFIEVVKDVARLDYDALGEPYLEGETGD